MNKVQRNLFLSLSSKSKLETTSLSSLNIFYDILFFTCSILRPILNMAKNLLMKTLLKKKKKKNLRTWKLRQQTKSDV